MSSIWERGWKGRQGKGRRTLRKSSQKSREGDACPSQGDGRGPYEGRKCPPIRLQVRQVTDDDLLVTMGKRDRDDFQICSAYD